jgi:hypothetical protein
MSLVIHSVDSWYLPFIAFDFNVLSVNLKDAAILRAVFAGDISYMRKRL